MRKLAREATIFALVGALLLAIFAFANLKGNVAENAVVSLIAGVLYGSLVGIGLWVVYRLVRFAVKG